MNLVSIAKTAGNAVIFQAKKHAPEILLALGSAGMLGTIFLASKETLKAKDVIEQHKEARATIEEASKLPKEEYSDDDRKKDKAQLYIATAKDLTKTYYPAIILGAASFACIFSSFGIIKGRNAAILAAYNAVSKSYEEYRNKVRDKIGEEEEADIYAGRVTEKVDSVKTNEEGKEVKTKEKIKVFKDSKGNCLWSVFFDELNPYNKHDPYLNKQVLQQMERDLTDKLNSKGWLSLLEAYEYVGIDIAPDDTRLKDLQLLGWRSKKYGGKGYVSFGLFDGYKQEKIDFVNGREKSVLLDFNIDGYIYDDFRIGIKTRKWDTQD